MSELEQKPLYLFDSLDDLKKIISQKEVFLFLDYDGTLTPIVDTPDLAILAESTRQVVRALSEKISISIVSGRATDDVQGKVNVTNVFYAGSHGFEIVDPQGIITVNEEAKKVRSTIDLVYEKLTKKLKFVSGALVEHVKYTISAHYRLVSDVDFFKVEKAVEEILLEFPLLRKTAGKKVFEIRPKIDWDKGRAVNWILTCLNYDPERHFPIYIGDDTTDEDAFAAIKEKGMGVLVSSDAEATAAKYYIKDYDDVVKTLDVLNNLIVK